jgi:hypothetical protein
LNPQLAVRYPERGAIKRIPRTTAVTADDEVRGRRQAKLRHAEFSFRRVLEWRGSCSTPF